jgi:polysaccharide deacetylase family protein (PEP-CTERM system associated)
MITTTAQPDVLLSFDVEEHFQIEAARDTIDPGQWDNWPGRIKPNLDWLLEQLAQHQATATFFVLGWVARRQPRIVRAIADAGHELACHGYGHDRLHRLDPDRLRADLAAARAAIEDQAQQPLIGYRAPCFSLTAQTAWAVDVIAGQGFAYDSSIQPIHHPACGQADAPRRPYQLVGPSGGRLLEVPPLTWRCGRLRLPVAGGGYFRLLPLVAMHRGIAQARRAGQPAPLYFHPWEFDPDQPRLPLGPRQRWRTYVGIRRTRPRLQTLLRRYRGRSYRQWLASEAAHHLPTHRLAPTPRCPRTQPQAQRRAA